VVNFPGNDEFLACAAIAMQVVLSNGDLVVDTGTNSSEDGDRYECVASFEQRNVTLARYRMVNPHGHSGIFS
jgi:hypothetical protein